MWSFDGRISRSQWWLGRLGLFLVVVMGFIALLQFSDDALQTLLPLWGLVVVYGLAVYWGYALDAKRWHDLDMSGWYSLVGFIPIYGQIWILCGLGFKKGTDGPNRYGPPTDSDTEPASHPGRVEVFQKFNSRPYASCRDCQKAWRGDTTPDHARSHSDYYGHYVVIKTYAK